MERQPPHSAEMEIEYVYALHDFEPQNDDEIAFVAGERIEVLERDDAYGDGWWTGRNLAGQEGIFPKDYTTPAGPLMPDLRTPTGQTFSGPQNGTYGATGSGFHSGGYGSTLHPLTEEPESDSAQTTNNTIRQHPNGTSQIPTQNNAGVGSSAGGGGIGKGGGQVMAATMTDIQHAIDQLGVRRQMTDDGQSYSFVSTRDDRTSIDDHERGYDDQRSVRDSVYEAEEVVDTTPGGHNRMTMNEDWHRDARRRLFEKVDQMDAQRRAQEEEEEQVHHHHKPPVDVEFSDESEDEEGHIHHHHHQNPPNDLLHRMQQQQHQHQLKHEDSIPSTLPETFQDHSTTSLGDGGLSTNNGGAKAVTDSPARADDSPTLDQYPIRPNDSRPSGPEPPSPRSDKRSLTPVPQPKPAIAERIPTPTSAPEPVKEIKDTTNHDQYLPAPVMSPFVPSPFSVPTSSGPPSAVPNQNYPITSSALYPPAKPAEERIQEREIKPPSAAAASNVPPPSPSYISFLPSPTAATFSAAQNAGTNLNAVPTSGGISQVLNQSTSNQSQTQLHATPSTTDVAKEASASTSNLSTTVPSIQNVDSSFISNGHASMMSTTTSSSLAPPPAPTQTSPPGKKRTPPSEWSVDQVVEWIRSKGFDEATCSKFAEHEISGDVLLEFDANMLKEIDIIAFGKRVKIANAISELRRPPSFESSDAVSLNPQSISQFSMIGGQSTISSAPQSGTMPGFSPSHHFPQPAPGFPQPSPGMPSSAVSMPNMTANLGFIQPSPNISHGHSMSHSTQGGYNASLSSAAPSVASPNLFGAMQAQQQQPSQYVAQSPGSGQTQLANGAYSPGPYVMISPGGGMYSGDIPTSANDQRPGLTHTHVRVDSDPGVHAISEAGRLAAGIVGYDKAATVGYSGIRGKNRPASLALSPSDSNLSQRNVAGVPIVLEDDDDRAALSDSDLRKRKKDIRSLDTTTTHEPPDTPRSDTPSRASARNRASFDTKTSDRLSFFSAIGRSRKPAPRYSSDQSGSDMGSPNITPAEKQKIHSKLYPIGPTRPPRVGKTKEEKEKEKKEKLERELAAKRKGKEPEKDHPIDPTASGILRKRTLSGDDRRPKVAITPVSPEPSGKSPGAVTLKPGEDVLKQLKEIVGEADHSGFMQKKGERYNTWKNRFFFLKGPHLYYLRSKHETRIKGYINIRGYKVIADEQTHPGRYGFRIVHDTQKPHFFSSEEQTTIREWMKALMKATIDRDYARPVVSSCNIPTIPLSVAQTMNPAPRPPSPGAVAAAQRASRAADASGLSSRDAKVLMGIADGSAILGNAAQVPVPARPSREMRRPSLVNKSEGAKGGSNAALLQWVNSQLPDSTPFATDFSTSLSSGLILFRLAESIKYGQDIASFRLLNPTPDDPSVPDKLFEGEDRIDGLMKLFDFLLDNDVKLSGISMADVKEGRSEKTIALIRSMKQWKEQRDAVAKSVGVGGQAGVLTWIH